MKKCFKCGIEKDLSEFYAHPRMGDGHLGKCKQCTKKDTQEREQRLRKNPEWCESEKRRAKEKYHRLNYRERQYELNKGKPYKNSKYKALHKNINLLKNQNAHHWNYNYVEDYIVLTKERHRFIHRFLRLDNSTLCFKTVTGELLDTKDKHLKYINSLQ